MQICTHTDAQFQETRCAFGIMIKNNKYTPFAIISSLVYLNTVPLNYNFTFTRVSTRVTTRGSRGKCQKLPWKASFPCDGPWLFHAKTRGISRHVEFPRDDM